MARTKTKQTMPRKPKGAKDKIPGQRKIRASIKAIIEDVVANEEKTVRKALVDGIKGGPRNAHHYLKMAAEYTDGKPGDNLRVQFDVDELAEAKKTLHEKLDILLKRLPSPDATEPPTE
jgi:elongation factor P hydroxylase